MLLILFRMVVGVSKGKSSNLDWSSYGFVILQYDPDPTATLHLFMTNSDCTTFRNPTARSLCGAINSDKRPLGLLPLGDKLAALQFLAEHPERLQAAPICQECVGFLQIL